MLPLTEMVDIIRTSPTADQQYKLMLLQVKKACWDGYITWCERLRMEKELSNAYKEVIKHGYRSEIR